MATGSVKYCDDCHYHDSRAVSTKVTRRRRRTRAFTVTPEIQIDTNGSGRQLRPAAKRDVATRWHKTCRSARGTGPRLTWALRWHMAAAAAAVEGWERRDFREATH